MLFLPSIPTEIHSVTLVLRPQFPSSWRKIPSYLEELIHPESKAQSLLINNHLSHSHTVQMLLQYLPPSLTTIQPPRLISSVPIQPDSACLQHVQGICLQQEESWLSSFKSSPWGQAADFFFFLVNNKTTTKPTSICLGMTLVYIQHLVLHVIY